MGSSTQTKKADFPRRTKRHGVEIVVAAQPPLFCEVLSCQLDDEPRFSVVGRASDSDHMWKVLARENPQVLLFDYEGLGSNAESMVHRLRRAAPAMRILALSNRSSDETAVRALGAGASGVVGKQLKFSVLVNAIQAVAEGEIWGKPRNTALALENLTAGSAGGSKSDLTKREYEVADACSRGLRNKEIAKLLHISEKTVKGHLNNIFRKLQVNNRFALGLYIREPTELKS
ncbi:MAG TPA: response regulator transcription factor [Thermoanaerobaculia bacterium]|jgi:NarL family two-component system response regulator LiaR|nr:response regulator transcription factor [Thermoanaerobaculia bacterium]